MALANTILEENSKNPIPLGFMKEIYLQIAVFLNKLFEKFRIHVKLEYIYIERGEVLERSRKLLQRSV